jgi:hypothetical protein
MPAPRRPPPSPASIWDEPALAAALAAAGAKPLHVQAIYRCVWRRGDGGDGGAGGRRRLVV